MLIQKNTNACISKKGRPLFKCKKGARSPLDDPLKTLGSQTRVKCWAAEPLETKYAKRKWSESGTNEKGWGNCSSRTPPKRQNQSDWENGQMHMWEFALNLHYGKLSLLVKSKTKLSVTTGLLTQKPLVFVIRSSTSFLPMQRRSFHAKKLLVLTQGRLVLLRPIRRHKGRTRFLHTTLWNTLPGASVQPSNAVFPAEQKPQVPRPDFSNGFFGELLLFLRRYLFALLYRDDATKCLTTMA